MLAYLNSYFNGTDSMNNVLAKLKTLQTDNFLTEEEIESVCSDAIKHYADAVKLPITKQHLQTVDTFINNIEVSRTTLNKTGALDMLGSRFYQGTLMSYFVENEPIDKVTKRTQIVTRLLPISSDQKEAAGLKVLEKAAHKYLSNGLITDSEQWHLDEFSRALALPVNNLPTIYKGSDIEKIQQSALLSKLQQGQMPSQANVTVPILLASGEYVIWQYTDVTMYQEKITKEWVGRSSGWSYRVCKGVYYRTGGSKGHPIEHSSMENVGVGTLVLTNKHIIFYSSQHASKIPYKKLIGVTPYADGIELQKDGVSAKRQAFQGFDSWFVMNLLSIINI